MKHLFILLSGIVFTHNTISQNLYSELFDNSSGITSGYGAWGANNYIRETPIEITDKGVITFYHPDISAAPKPTIFFISGWGQTYETYDRFFKFLASLGYPTVNIYNYNPGSITTSYQNSLDMMQYAATQYSNWIDTTKIGLMGHSYGGGSCIWLGKNIFDSDGLNWGSSERFIMMFAPWLSFLMEDIDLQNYPENVKLLILQSYDDFNSGGNPTYNTDPRALRAVYELIDIPDNEKDFITLYSDNDAAHEYIYNGHTYSYIANHYVSYTNLIDAYNNPYDALDVYASNRLAHALIDYVFEGNTAAKEVALGNGSAVQIDMSIMPDLSVTDYYITNRPESDFEYKCSENTEGSWGDPDIWKLQDYCEDADGNGVIDNLSNKDYVTTSFTIYPVPSNDHITIRFPQNNQNIETIAIYDALGKLLYHSSIPETNSIDISQFETGTYTLKLYTKQSLGIQKFMVK